MVEGNGGEKVTYSTKELLSKIETSLGDKIDGLGGKLDLVTDKHEAEIRDVRHRVANLEAVIKLREPMEAAESATVRDDIKTIKQDIAVLKTESASQHAVDSFKKWVVTFAVVGCGGLAVSIIQLVTK